MKKIITTLAHVFVILGAVMGAGFMTGTEIQSFFARFGSVAYITIAINCAIFALFVAIYGLKNAKDSIKWPSNTKKINLMPICQLFLTASMMSGASNLLSKIGVNSMLSNWLIFAFVFLCLLIGIKSANFFNIITTSCALVCFVFIAYDGKMGSLGTLNLTFAPFALAVFYASMNIATSSAIIEKVAKVSTKKQIMQLSIFVFVILAIVSYALLGIVGQKVNSMPLLSVIRNDTFKSVYYVVVMFAMISTMLSSGVGAKKMFNTFGNLFGSIICTLVCFLISFFGFEFIIKYLYPVVGLLLIIQGIVNIIIKIVCKNKQNA